MAIQKQGNFSFNHRDQADKLYETYTAEQIKQKFDSRAEELKTTLNKMVDLLNSSTGAQNIGALDGGIVSTIQAILDKKTDKSGNHEGTWQGLSPEEFDTGEQAIEIQKKVNKSGDTMTGNLLFDSGSGTSITPIIKRTLNGDVYETRLIIYWTGTARMALDFTKNGVVQNIVYFDSDEIYFNNETSSLNKVKVFHEKNADRTERGSTTITASGGAVGSKSIIFSRAFGGIPTVLPVLSGTAPNLYGKVSVSSVTTTGCNLHVHNEGASSATVPISYVVVGR